jgi:hypothetical protein
MKRKNQEKIKVINKGCVTVGSPLIEKDQDASLPADRVRNWPGDCEQAL